MSVRRLAAEQPEGFAFTPENLDWAKAEIKKYPEGRQASAVLSLLWRAQEQMGGWISEPALRAVADMLGMAYIRVLEVATFYTMFHLEPVGTKAHVQVCGTTPCMLRGSDDIMATCRKRGMAPGHTTDDGMWTLTEVECMGNCASAPMVQINDDNYEDLTPERIDAVLDALARGETPKAGTQDPARHTVEPVGEATSLKQMVTENHDYRSEW